MRKTLSIVLAFLMICNLFSIFALENGNLQEEAGEFLKTLGVIKGDENGNLNAESLLTREEAISILIRMLGKSEEAKSTKPNSEFRDVLNTHWAARDIAYAKKQGWTEGVGNGNFGINKEVTAKEIASFMLRALNYSANWESEDIMEKARRQGVLKDVDSSENTPITRGEVFIIIKNTLSAKVNGSEENLSQKLFPEKNHANSKKSNEKDVAEKKLTPTKDIEFVSWEDGSIMHLSDFKGKPVVLNFWASWCPYCIRELPALNEAYKEYADKGIEVIAVNLAYNDFENDAKEAIEKAGAQFILASDKTGAAAKAFAVRSIPTNVFIDKDGNIVESIAGAPNKSQWTSLMQKLLE